MKLLANSQGKLLLNSQGKAYEAPEVAPDSDVIFIDYDGTIRHSYSAAEFANLTALPANPTHEGLTAQGWNWTLADAKEAVALSGFLTIGQMYITDDGKTYAKIYIPKGDPTTVTFYINQTAANGVTFDFGDGSSTQTASSNGKVGITHTFPSDDAEYTVALTPNTGYYRLGDDWPGEHFIGDQNYYLKSIRHGSNILNLGWQCFADATNLESITMPLEISGMAAYSLNHCHLLRAFVIPSSATGFGAYQFINTYCMTAIAVPYSITSYGVGAFNATSIKSLAIFKTDGIGVGQDMSLRKVYISDYNTSLSSNFYACWGLEEITIPATVTSLLSTFNQCSSLRRIHFKSTTPPTIDQYTFYNVPATCVFYVPKGSLTAYQTATNWSTYTSQIKEE